MKNQEIKFKNKKIKIEKIFGWVKAKPRADPINGAVQGVATATASTPVPNEFL